MNSKNHKNIKPFLSVVIAAYNEETRISGSLLDIDCYLSKQGYPYEIIVVNDGSTDRTAEVVRRFTGLIKNLKLIDNRQNRGKGAGIKQGMLASRGEYCLFIDADNSVSFDQLENFWPWFKEGYDIVIGSIEIKGAKIEEHAAWYRRLLGKWAKYLIRLLAVWEIHDTQRGFKLFSAKAVQEIFPLQTIERWGFDIEILVIAKRRGYKIKEVPVVWVNAAGSKVTLSGYWRTLKELLKIKWNLIRHKYD